MVVQWLPEERKEKGQLAYPFPLTHTHNRRIRGNPASGGARSSPGASAYDGFRNEIKRKTKGQLVYFSHLTLHASRL